MSDATFIQRHTQEDEASGFSALRRLGIEHSQALSGQRWTDYNLHDPGVTILEQLCYALTDLMYRSGFDVADFLVNEEGQLDFEQQGLQRPENIFPCRPTTIQDYRKAILDAVSELDNIWLIPALAEAPACTGLYKLYLKFEQGVDAAKKAKLLDQVNKFYIESRNLCEDLLQIQVVEGVDYQLCADIEVSSHRPPVDILAEVYFSCYRQLSSGIGRSSYDEVMAEENGLDDVFNGPFTRNGIFEDESLGNEGQSFLISSLYSQVNRIEGIDHVRELCLERDGQRFYESIAAGSPEAAANLIIPSSIDDMQVQISVNGRGFQVSITELQEKFNELNFRYHSSHSSNADLSKLIPLPVGKRRSLKEYFSIQNQFPARYGIGEYGIPASAPARDKAQAKQLKAYLVLFEQVMVNHLENLGAVKDIFSVNDWDTNTSTVAPLLAQQVPGLAEVYPEQAFALLSQIQARYDNPTERRSRLLDYLLALYGESFSQNSLRHFNYYYTATEVEKVIVENKAQFLRSIVSLSRDRAAGANYLASSWRNRGQTGLQQRANMLLGFKRSSARSLTMAILKQGLKLCHHDIYQRLKGETPEYELIDMDSLPPNTQASFIEVPLSADRDSISLNEVRAQLDDAIPIKSNLISDMLLRNGIYLEKYRLGSLTDGQTYQLIFKGDKDHDWFLGTFRDRESGIQAANTLRRFLLRLNVESEGMHVVEHMLLRPTTEGTGKPVELSNETNFFSFRVSVILPAWTARCHDHQFRMLAEETISLNTPAHILPEFYWLTFQAMYKFEILYEKWMGLKSKGNAGGAELDAAANDLVQFLLEHKLKRRDRA